MIVKLGPWEQKKEQIKSLEEWCYERIMKIKWTFKITNEDVLRRIRASLSLRKSIVKDECNSWIL